MQIYVEVEEVLGTTASKLCKDLEDYGILLMSVGSSRLLLFALTIFLICN